MVSPTSIDNRHLPGYDCVEPGPRFGLRKGSAVITSPDSSHWLAAIVESSDDAILSKTLDGTILTWNAAAERLYGYTAAEAIGRPVSMLLPPDRPLELEEILGRLAQGERIDSFRTRRLRKDGTVIYVVLSSSPVHDEDGSIVGAATIARDVSKDKKFEEQARQAQKLEAIGRLAGGIAHDFNNLLTAIHGYGAVALNRTDQGDVREELEQILRAAGRATELTRQLLAFSRQQPIAPTPVDLNRVIQGLVPMLRRLIGEDVEIKASLEDDLPPIESDATQLEQVIVNLALNARDAMSNGGTLSIETRHVFLDEGYARAHEGVTPGSHAMLVVSDTGVGMDAETRERLFEPFFTTKEVGRGTGLGLSTVYGIVEQQGGHVWFYSEPGQGAVFKIYLPCLTDEVVVPPETPEVQSDVGGSETILVVEDAELVRGLAVSVLSAAGYEVLEAIDGLDALELAQSHEGSIDLLLTDVIMPGMSGPTLVRRFEEAGRRVETVFMSGYAGDAIGNHGVPLGEANVLEKPFAPNTLLEKVHTALDRRAAAARASR